MKYDKDGLLIKKRDEIIKMFNKPINKTICRENLLLVKEILGDVNVPCRLIYGTLLGAVREKDFITGDQDTDLLFFYYEKEKVLGCVKEFEKTGFCLIRKLDNILSVERKGEYIDFYFFKQNSFADCLFNRLSCGYGKYWFWISNKYLKEFTEILFIDKKFLVFEDSVKWLEFTYGKDWKIPKNKSADTRTFSSFAYKHIRFLVKEIRRNKFVLFIIKTFCFFKRWLK